MPLEPSRGLRDRAETGWTRLAIRPATREPQRET